LLIILFCYLIQHINVPAKTGKSTSDLARIDRMRPTMEVIILGDETILKPRFVSKLSSHQPVARETIPFRHRSKNTILPILT
jgi:hypothetical protein